MSGNARPVSVPSQRLRRYWDGYGLTHVPYRLLMVTKMLDRSISAQLDQEDGISLAEWRVMANLNRVGASTVTELADQAQVDRAEVSRAARSLEARGLVIKSPHPTSRAKKRISLSSEGADMAGRISSERRAFYGYLLEGLDETQRQMFDDLLLHVATRIEHFEQASTAKGRKKRASAARSLTPEPAP
jgi:DNA-binding MarR family transcriptional regulator